MSAQDLSEECLSGECLSGLLVPAGVAVIDAAKVDGSWTKLDHVDTLTVPDDLARALDGYTAARSNFDAFPPSTRRRILEWILQATTEPTRAKRIDEPARLAAENLRANKWSRR